MIIKFDIARSINMTQRPGACVDVLDVCASAEEMPFVADLVEHVRQFAQSYPDKKENP